MYVANLLTCGLNKKLCIEVWDTRKRKEKMKKEFKKKAGVF